jgi:hypothetical protein
LRAVVFFLECQEIVAKNENEVQNRCFVATRAAHCGLLRNSVLNLCLVAVFVRTHVNTAVLQILAMSTGSDSGASASVCENDANPPVSSRVAACQTEKPRDDSSGTTATTTATEASAAAAAAAATASAHSERQHDVSTEEKEESKGKEPKDSATATATTDAHSLSDSPGLHFHPATLPAVSPDSHYKVPDISSVSQTPNSEWYYVSRLDHVTQEGKARHFKVGDWTAASQRGGHRDTEHGHVGAIAVKPRRDTHTHSLNLDVTIIVVFESEEGTFKERSFKPSQLPTPTEAAPAQTPEQQKHIITLAKGWVQREHVQRQAKRQAHKELGASAGTHTGASPMTTRAAEKAQAKAVTAIVDAQMAPVSKMLRSLTQKTQRLADLMNTHMHTEGSESKARSLYTAPSGSSSHTSPASGPGVGLLPQQQQHQQQQQQQLLQQQLLQLQPQTATQLLAPLSFPGWPATPLPLLAAALAQSQTTIMACTTIAVAGRRCPLAILDGPVLANCCAFGPDATSDLNLRGTTSSARTFKKEATKVVTMLNPALGSSNYRVPPRCLSKLARTSGAAAES